MISVMVMGYLHMILEMYMKGSIVMDKGRYVKADGTVVHDGRWNHNEAKK
jgi:hypothetical protein